MKHFNNFGLAAVAVMALMALVETGTASATTLEVSGVKQAGSVTIEATAAAGTSALFQSKGGAFSDTCTSSSIKFKTETFSGATVGGKVSSLTFTGCAHTTHVINPGSLSIAWTSGTNGTVSSSGAELTAVSTVFGVSCIIKTGTGTPLGTLTGVKAGQAGMHVNGLLSSPCGEIYWKGIYAVTSPSGLGVVS